MTATDRPRHRFRYWPAPQDDEPPIEAAPVELGHTHEQRKLPFVIAYVSLALLAIAVGFLLIYVLGRSELRDQREREIREQVRESLCDVLDGLPEGGVLDLTRDKLGCGPGLPLDSFTPDIQQQFSPAPQPTVVPGAPAPATATPSAAPEPPPAASSAPAQPPAPESPAPPPAGATTGPPSSGEPVPVSPPSQLQQVLCGLLPICSEGTP